MGVKMRTEDETSGRRIASRWPARLGVAGLRLLRLFALPMRFPLFSPRFGLVLLVPAIVQFGQPPGRGRQMTVAKAGRNLARALVEPLVGIQQQRLGFRIALLTQQAGPDLTHGPVSRPLIWM